jgi:hypothetical protein
MYAEQPCIPCRKRLVRRCHSVLSKEMQTSLQDQLSAALSLSGNANLTMFVEKSGTCKFDMGKSQGGVEGVDESCREMLEKDALRRCTCFSHPEYRVRQHAQAFNPKDAAFSALSKGCFPPSSRNSRQGASRRIRTSTRSVAYLAAIQTAPYFGFSPALGQILCAICKHCAGFPSINVFDQVSLEHSAKKNWLFLPLIEKIEWEDRESALLVGLAIGYHITCFAVRLSNLRVVKGL